MHPYKGKSKPICLGLLFRFGLLFIFFVLFGLGLKQFTWAWRGHAQRAKFVQRYRSRTWNPAQFSFQSQPLRKCCPSCLLFFFIFLCFFVFLILHIPAWLHHCYKRSQANKFIAISDCRLLLFLYLLGAFFALLVSKEEIDHRSKGWMVCSSSEAPRPNNQNLLCPLRLWKHWKPVLVKFLWAMLTTSELASRSRHLIAWIKMATRPS